MRNDSVIEIVELTSQELELIKSIRDKWRFGEITILVRDGNPYRMRRVFEFIDLDFNKSKEVELKNGTKERVSTLK